MSLTIKPDKWVSKFLSVLIEAANLVLFMGSTDSHFTIFILIL